MAAPPGAKVVDLSNSTVLPGLIDNHTHVLLQAHPTPTDYDEQLIKESIAYRAIRATVSARIALENGFTTIRDLETEGAMYADVDVKTAINRGIVPGPRMFVATRALAPTGMYNPTRFSWELEMPGGVQFADGADGVRKAVREQIKYGADWIKYYADGGTQFRDGAIHSRPNYTDEESKALVDEAHRMGHKVAAHAGGKEAIDSALRAGVDTIEHGNGMDEELADLMLSKGAYWCPTLYIYNRSGRSANSEMMQAREKGFRSALAERREDHLRHRHRRVCVDRIGEQGIRADGEVGHDADAGDSIGHTGGRHGHRSAGTLRRDRSGQVRRHRGGLGRPYRGHHATGACPVCDEGRGDLQEVGGASWGGGRLTGEWVSGKLLDEMRKIIGEY